MLSQQGYFVSLLCGNLVISKDLHQSTMGKLEFLTVRVFGSTEHFCNVPIVSYFFFMFSWASTKLEFLYIAAGGPLFPHLFV